MRFEFATSNQILFGPGVFQESGRLAVEMGRSALVACGVGCERAEPLLELLRANQVEARLFEVNGEPTVDLVQAGVQATQQAGCDLVIGFGGGSAVDTAKAVAALATNLAADGDIFDYLEVIGRGKALSLPSLACIAIPTTAGTGAEVTRNAVLGAPEQGVKVSLRSPWMIPRLALVDPQLTYSLPPDVTASTGLDALTQLIEPFVSKQSNPLTDAICREGMRRAAGALQRAYENGSDPAARQDMALASLFGGLALANAKLGAVHGFAGPIGGSYPAPHGAVCARLLPYVVAMNVRLLQAGPPESEALKKYEEVARILTGRESAGVADGIAWLHELIQALNIPPLSAYGLTPASVPELVENSARASSMKGNPVQLSLGEMAEILNQAM